MKEKRKTAIEETETYDYARWRKTFLWVGLILFFVILFLEIGIFFVLKTENLIQQPLPIYFRDYLLRPVVLNLFVLTVGNLGMKLIKKEQIKNAIPVLIITVMFGISSYIHSVFQVVMVVFCIPIFITIIFKSRAILTVITVLSEGFILGTALMSTYEGQGISQTTYFLPSTILSVIMVLVCGSLANICIKILNKQDEELLHAMFEAKAAEERAEEASKSKSTFLSNMSHEIRTPINAVLGLDEMIIRESTEKNIKNYALDIRSSGRALLSLINDILDFSKIESGKMEILPVEYDLSSVVNDLVNMIANKAYEKGLSFQVKVDPKLPHVLYGDEVRIRQVILNILSNAVKYTEKGSVILNFGFEKSDDSSIEMFISVEDTGKGIKEEDLDKLFTAFERIEETRNRHIEGTGLGMNITKQLLAMMGSRLEVKSVYGEGSTFSFRLIQEVRDWVPIGNYEESHKKLREMTKEYTQSFMAPKAKMLVVDDMPINLTVVQGLLKRTGIQIDTAVSGKECLQLASRNRYHIILLDHMMPDMDGIETLGHLKKDSESLNKDVPTVILTANAVSGAREQYIKEGFDEYLTKPIDTVRLEEMISRLLPAELVQFSDNINEKPSKDSCDTGTKDEMLTKLAVIEFLNVEQGIAASGGEEIYRTVIEEFAKTATSQADTINQLYEQKDIKGYTIQVHALKSTARLAGALELSKLAGKLEQCGREEDLETIDELTGTLLQMYRDLGSELEGALCDRENEKQKPFIGEAQLKEAMVTLLEGMETFDFDMAQSVMEQLENYRLPDSFAEKYKKLRVLMAEVARDEIIELLSRE